MPTQSIQNIFTTLSMGALNALQMLKRLARSHKVLSAIIAVAIIALSWFVVSAVTGTSGQTRYVLGSVAEGTIVSSITASGQVSATQALNLVAKSSGQVIYVGVVPGQKVAAGTLVAEIDPTTAVKAVRDAEANLEAAQLSLSKVQEPADALSTAQATNVLASSYDSSRSDIVSTYLDLQVIILDLKDINDRIGGNQFASWSIGSSGGEPLRTAALQSYDAARSAYQTSFADYSGSTISSVDGATVQRLLVETENTTELIASTVKSESAFLAWYEDILKTNNQTPVSSANTDISNLTSYAGKLGTHLSSLISDESGITEHQLSLTKLQTGADTIDVQSSQLSVTKAQNALSDAQNNLADYYIRTPFAGVIGSVLVQKYDQAGSAAVATLITQQQVADLSLNEVDAAKIALGDKATLTFDAIPDLTLTGTVAEIDPVGTVAQGVVSYNIKIAFDSQDPRIKTGMTINAAIQTAVHTNVLTVPSGAVKTTGGQQYVLVFTPPLEATSTGSAGVVSASAPAGVSVQTGITDDTNVEIVSGLTAGEQIVVRTITGSTVSAPTPAAGAGGRGGGGGGFGGGALRIGG